MVLCEWDAPEGDPGQSCVHLFARILSTSFSSVSIFSVCCYSRVSISMGSTGCSTRSMLCYNLAVTYCQLPLGVQHLCSKSVSKVLKHPMFFDTHIECCSQIFSLLMNGTTV